MELPVSSNLVSGLYSCFEVLLCAFLTHILSVCVACYNTKKIYEDREKLALTTNRFQHVANFGLTSKIAHRISMVIFSTVCALVTIGGFAIVGVTRTIPEEVKYLVTRMPYDDLMHTEKQMDIEKHVSLERKEVSASIMLMLQFVKCRRGSQYFSTFYAYFYNRDRWNGDLDTVSIKYYDGHFLLNDVHCLLPSSNFIHEVIAKMDFPTDEEVPPQCKLDFRLKERKYFIPVRTKVHQRGNCTMEVREAWCIRNETLKCSLSIKRREGFGVVTYDPGGAERLSLSPVRKEVDSKMLRSVTIVMGLRLPKPLSILTIWLGLTVQKDATVQRISREQGTKIHTSLLVGTLVPALCVTFVACTTALICWFRSIVRHERQDYNRFNTEMELLRFVAFEANNKESCGFQYCARTCARAADGHCELHHQSGQHDDEIIVYV